MKTIQFILFLMITTKTINTQSVVFLEGSSRSGKSSICSAIKDFYGWESISSLYLYYCHETFFKIAPQAFTCIQKFIDKENITHAITKNIFIFKDPITEEQKNTVKNSVKEIQTYFNETTFCDKHMNDFCAYARTVLHNYLDNGLHVLADTSWYISKTDAEKINPSIKIINTLAYCPLHIIIDRILYRNKISLETGDVMNYRFLKEPLLSFKSLYNLSSQPTDGIDILEKNTFLRCLESIEQHLPNITQSDTVSDFIMQELTIQQLKTYRAQFLEKFESLDILYVVPKKKYDIILKTNMLTPQESALQITQYVENLKI